MSRRTPFRLIPAAGMAAALLAGGIWSGAIRRDPSPAFLARWGYDLATLRTGRFSALVTMTLFPTAHSDWLPMLLQTVLLVAFAGWFAGAWWALAAFWVPNIIGTALVSLSVIWPLDAAGFAFARGWATEPDSGASVGMYGTLGFLLALLPRPPRWIAVGGMAAWLIVAIARERHVWNVEHLGGYLLGVALGVGNHQSAAGGRRPAVRLRYDAPIRHAGIPDSAGCHLPTMGGNMQGFTGIGHIAIRARDLDPMLDFYTKTLGFAEMFRLHTDEGALMLVYLRVTETQYLEFFPNGTGDGPAPREAVGLNHVCLTVDDLDNVVAQLTARGVPLARPLITGRDGNRQAWIEDPEGNRLELMEMSPASKQAEALARLNRA